jgi:diphosphomevalonate decarboxylase
VKKSDVVRKILHDKTMDVTSGKKGIAFAPTNIALCKYWGKRDTELNLPVTSSLSIALPEKGAQTTISIIDADNDVVILNGNKLENNSAFVKRLVQYLDLFRREHSFALHIDINMNIPVAAGLASSACGFASLITALNNLFGWELTKRELSILARLGSGSASRSMWTGFVEWHAGVDVDGMDSYAESLKTQWPELQVGILSITNAEKPISSRAAMQRTVENSVLYQSWPQKVAMDLGLLKQALQDKDMTLLGSTAESNALAMHATMLASWPPVCYFLPETIDAMHQVWGLRSQGIDVYFTEDAGPNVKLLFLDKDKEKIRETFPQVEIIKLFD